MGAMRLPAWLIVIAGLAGLVVGGVVGTCHGTSTRAERRADTLLADTLALRDTVRLQDSVIAAGLEERAVLRTQSREQAKVVAVARRKADSLVALIDSVIQPGSASDSVAQLTPIVEGQQRALVQFRLTVGAMDFQHHLDSLALRQADSTIALDARWREADRARIAALTTSLRDLRKEREHGGSINVLGLHIPRCVLPASGGGLAGGLLDSDQPLRGALIGSASGLVGCLVS